MDNGIRVQLRLYPTGNSKGPFTLTINTLGKNKTTISTAACGCILLETPEKGFASGLVEHECSVVDGMMTAVVVAPISIIDYLALMRFALFSSQQSNRIPHSMGYIISPQLVIESQQELNVTIDGETATKTPAEFKVHPGALKINHGIQEQDLSPSFQTAKEKNITRDLPAGKEVQKAQNKKVPFFTYASEERFKDLFIALRDDGRINSTYIVLVVLSTFLATIGLYLDSASVISILLQAMDHCGDSSDRACINRMIRDSKDFIGIFDKIRVNRNGKTTRPVYINTIDGKDLKFKVKVY